MIGDDRLDLDARVDSGVAQLIADPGHPQGWTLVVNDVAQSYVDLADPTRLPMMYARLVAAVADAAGAATTPLRALHLGAGGLTLPRYIAATRPGSRQTVVEIDRGLAEFVRYGLPLPPDAEISIELDDAADAILRQPRGEYGLIVSDIYRGGRMPAAVAGVPFAERAGESLTPDGLFVVNVLDAVGLLGTRKAAATLRVVFPHVAVIATPPMLRGRRDGNVLVIGARVPLRPQRILAAANRHDANARSLSGDDLSTFIAGTAPITE